MGGNHGPVAGRLKLPRSGLVQQPPGPPGPGHPLAFRPCTCGGPIHRPPLPPAHGAIAGQPAAARAGTCPGAATSPWVPRGPLSRRSPRRRGDTLLPIGQLERRLWRHPRSAVFSTADRSAQYRGPVRSVPRTDPLAPSDPSDRSIGPIRSVPRTDPRCSVGLSHGVPTTTRTTAARRVEPRRAEPRRAEPRSEACARSRTARGRRPGDRQSKRLLDFQESSAPPASVDRTHRMRSPSGLPNALENPADPLG